MGSDPTFVKIMTIFTAGVKHISDLNPQSSVVFVFMPMLGVRPVLVCVGGRLVFMPVAVGDRFCRCRKRVIVVPVVVTMPVFVGNTLMMVEVGVFFEKQQGQ